MNKKRLQALLRIIDIEINGDRPWDVHIKDEDIRKVRFGSIAIGEAYMDGLWSTKDLLQTFSKIFESESKFFHSLRCSNVICNLPYFFLKIFFNLQNKLLASRSIKHHYDIGNELYERMLDKNMVYTCAYWANATTLEEAQIAKYDLICRKIKLKKGDSVLDIGCGFGTFAKYAAETYGASVVGVTLSEEQKKYGDEINKHLPVEILLKDYRDVSGTFDHIVSIGMFEHVGRKNYKEFFRKVKELLKDDGLCLLHTIGSNRQRQDPWIHKYIFPEGEIPSVRNVVNAIGIDFFVEDWHNFGYDYSLTLIEWHKRFLNSWSELQAIDSELYTERFKRMWEFYLLSSAASFSERRNHLWQIVLSKKGVKGGYRRVS